MVNKFTSYDVKKVFSIAGLTCAKCSRKDFFSMDENLVSKLAKVAKQEAGRSSKQTFKAICVYLGVEPREHFAKERDASGAVVKVDGKDVRKKESDGFTYTFSEVGTSKIVKVVYPKRVKLDMLAPYLISGLGFDIRQSSMIFIDEAGKIALYQ